MSLQTENKIILCPENRCRICLEATNGKIALNQTINYEKAEISLNDLLEFCMNEQVCEIGKADGLCLACMEKGIVCYEFKKKFEESQSILLKEIEEGNSFLIKTEEDLKEEDLVEITETEILKEEISDKEVLTENDEIVNEEILEDDILVGATENGVLNEEISNEEVLTENEEILEDDVLLGATENGALNEEISDEEVLTENEEILEDDVLVVATENGVLNEEISNEKVVTENVEILKEKSLDKKVHITETIKCLDDQQDILNTPGDKPTAISFKGRKGSLRRHKLLKHSSLEQENTPKYKCDVCEKTFKLRNNFVKHTRRHRQEVVRKKVSCPTCGRKFYKNYLNVHMLTHSGEKPFPCEFCGRSFSQRSNLVSHRRIHSGERPHKCSECGKGFTRNASLRRHLVVHSEKREKRAFHISGTTFVGSSTLRINIKTPSAEHLFKCTICKKRFNRRWNLNVHRKIHTGEFTHVCKVCGKGFRSISNFKRHMKTH